MRRSSPRATGRRCSSTSVPSRSRSTAASTGSAIDRLTVVAITHAHADHAGGWSGAIAGRDVGTVLVGPTGGPGALRAELVGSWPGRAFVVGQLSVEVLWPTAARCRAGRSDGSAMNDASLVLRVTMTGDHPLRLLLTGDVEPDAQEALLRLHPDVAADVIKVPHHGSGRQSDRFFAAVGARVATISAGRGQRLRAPSRSGAATPARPPRRVVAHRHRRRHRRGDP